jgi:hypothetical protein
MTVKMSERKGGTLPSVHRGGVEIISVTEQ